jgi:hypothetical protein
MAAPYGRPFSLAGLVAAALHLDLQQFSDANLQIQFGIGDMLKTA